MPRLLRFRSRSLRVALTSTLCVAFLGGAAQAGDELSEAEARGKHIYTEGESPKSRIITAAIARSEAPVSASILPCIQCHGVDGRGIGVISPDINWDELVDASGHEHLQRSHGAFDAATVARAIRSGLDTAGNELEATMPRYAMADEDMADLIAYLKRIDTELDPGLSADTIRIGTVLPISGPLGDAGYAMRRIIDAYFASVNSNGGIHGRDLELVVGAYGAEDTPAFWEAQDLVRRESLFALVASYLPGFEEELSKLANEQQIPLIGPYTWLNSDGGGRYEFILQAGLAEQSEALVEAVVTKAVVASAELPRLGVVYPLVQGFDEIAETVRDRAARHNIERVAMTPYTLDKFDATTLAGKLKDADIEGVVFLGSMNEFGEFGRAADALDWSPTLLAPGLLAEQGVYEIPQSFGGQVYLAYGSLPSDHTREGMGLFEALHQDRGLDYGNSVAQIAAFSAARVLVEGLRRAGPYPSRERLISSLESLADFESGLIAPISFAPDRRMGTGGAYVVQVDLSTGRLNAEQNWISLD